MRILVPLALLLVAGCTHPITSPSGKEVERRSVNAGVAMAKAGRTSSAVDHARRVVGDVGEASIELMSQEGDGIKGQVVLRITATVEGSGYVSGSHTTACFRYVFDDASGGLDPRSVTCPSNEPLSLPALAPVPPLPADVEQRVRSVLAAADVDAALRQQFPGLVARSDRQGAVVGVSVLAGGDCEYGRRLDTDVIEVWRVPRVLAQPGELGCDPQFATRGDGKTAPH